MDLKEADQVGESMINLAQDRDMWQNLVITVS